MSLNRVASLESLVVAPQEARSRRASVASYGSVRPNKLTFNPVPHPEWEEVVETDTVAAFKVPKWKRLCTPPPSPFPRRIGPVIYILIASITTCPPMYTTP